MKILMIHNEYGRFSGEERIFYDTAKLLKENGHELELFVKGPKDLLDSRSTQIAAFFSGIWSWKSSSELSELLSRFNPDLVEFQNLYPFISPSILPVLKSHNLPIVYRCANYRLFCPTGLMLRDDKPCEICATRSQLNCVKYNCEGSMPKSLGYALRNQFAKKRILNSVDRYLVLSSFQEEKFIAWGIDERKVKVLPNFVSDSSALKSQSASSNGHYVAYLGRISPEKGIATLVAAARATPQIEFRLAGHQEKMRLANDMPANIHLVGELDEREIRGFLSAAVAVLVPSICYEGFGLSAVEAMLAERPVIASRVGGLADIVVDGETGLLVEPGSVDDLFVAIERLWQDRVLVDEMGRKGRERALREYSADSYYDKLIAIYEETIEERT